MSRWRRGRWNALGWIRFLRVIRVPQVLGPVGRDEACLPWMVGPPDLRMEAATADIQSQLGDQSLPALLGIQATTALSGPKWALPWILGPSASAPELSLALISIADHNDRGADDGNHCEREPLDRITEVRAFIEWRRIETRDAIGR
jgi:hypothetical protein